MLSLNFKSRLLGGFIVSSKACTGLKASHQCKRTIRSCNRVTLHAAFMGRVLSVKYCLLCHSVKILLFNYR